MILQLGREAEDRRFTERQRELDAVRIREERYRRKKKWLIKRLAFFCGVIFAIIAAVVLIIVNINKEDDADEAIATQVDSVEVSAEPIAPVVDNSIMEEELIRQQEEEERLAKIYSAQDAENMVSIGEDVLSEYAIVLDVNADEIVASRNGRTRINPASMTKILTALVAIENIKEENLDDPFTITNEITYFAYKNDCSAVGFADDEVVTVRDLLYGTILPSGGDAALALAIYVAGSQEAFVDLMNEKLEEIGVSETAHFTNCVGLYDENHYCTCYDMAMMLHAAIDNELCREVLSARVYTTSKTEQHPDGIEISNWFLRRIEDKPIGGDVRCGKTGYVNQSGNCAASFASDEDGNNYIVVTGNAPGSWKCIYDHVRIYRQFFPKYNSEGDSNANTQENDNETDEEAFG